MAAKLIKKNWINQNNEIIIVYVLMICGYKEYVALNNLMCFVKWSVNTAVRFDKFHEVIKMNGFDVGVGGCPGSL